MNRRMIALLLATLLVVAGCSSSGGGKPTPSSLNDHVATGPYQGVGLDTPRPRPAFTLTDTQGKAFAFGTVTAGHPTLLYFGYTNCPDICPTTMADIHNALEKVPATIQQQTYVVFVSTDVKRDTGPVIARWLQNFDSGVAAHFVGLRGTQAQIDAAQAASHVLVAEDDGQTHSTQVLLYGPDNYARVSYIYSGTGGDEAAAIAHDLPIIAKS